MARVLTLIMSLLVFNLLAIEVFGFGQSDDGMNLGADLVVRLPENNAYHMSDGEIKRPIFFDIIIFLLFVVVAI